MTVTAVIGSQWGDEGKGKVVDYLAERMDYVARFNGGNNAGHTVINEYGTFKIHLVPSGIVAGSVAVARDATARYHEEKARRGQSEGGLSNGRNPSEASRTTAQPNRPVSCPPPQVSIHDQEIHHR